MKTILIAEDEESSIALFLAMAAGHADWNLLIARSGDEAISVAAETQLDIALLDIQLPGPDGFEICRHIKASAEPTYVVMVSAMTQEVSRSKARAAGADDFVTKPFSTTGLTQLIERALA